jgi:starch synthase
VDYEEWNPQTDKYIVAHYDSEDLSVKQHCKEDLLEHMGLPSTDLNIPVIGIVSRFAAQKGFDLIGQIIDRLVLEDILFTVLGSGDRLYEEMFMRLAKRVPGKIAVRIAYDNMLAHKIEAGADMFLMPSHYEPCGLSQIYSLKYGTVPIVRSTGGLDDTVDLWDPRTKKGTGFKFQEYTGDALLRTIHQALQVYRDQTSWQRLMRNGMAKDFSWKISAREYIRVYERVRQQHAQAILV